MICANCGNEINVGDDYLEVLDNYLQIHYFESAEEAIFCSEQCLCSALSVAYNTNWG